jgi:RNA polymerase sigma-70 factor (ECF subfamily)
MIRRLLAGLLRGEPEELEDAEQEVLLAVSRSLPGFGFRSSLATWIYSVARRRALDLLRSSRRRRRRLERIRLRQLPADLPSDPLEPLLAQERSGRLLRAFRGLPAGDRQLVMMRDVEGFSLEEIAGLIRVPLGTVKSRLHRARARLARAMEAL